MTRALGDFQRHVGECLNAWKAPSDALEADCGLGHATRAGTRYILRYASGTSVNPHDLSWRAQIRPYKA